MNLKQISILGCGWLGLPLAKDFIKEGISVKGSTTSPDKIDILTQSGITPYLLTLGEASSATYLDFLSESELLIINFPPRRIPNITEVYQQQIRSILPYIGNNQKVIFISSTSVYENTNDWVTEIRHTQPEKESGKAVAAVEQILHTQLQHHLTIIRLSGLIGYDRLPGRFLANKKEVPNGDAPINVIHRDDCLGIIKSVINTNNWGEIFNGCADKHPLRKEYYTLAAEKIGLTPPTFSNHKDTAYKLISNAKSKEVLAYEYLHPDPLKLL
ncbi:SDR family oxidoreductase [Aquimarina hainanensis]|uniref:SDR family oxidoreductase n=1 Tax=Aquimarina hainanensis TaxID=1578017 RepID=A0ABW5NDB4_9FLAO|nr:SDR family oxidoreductase [Aquimarina sp. TRL1]QKX07078.1 SDR family oxidoreductase [Aquimarina sp. TRL1]